MISKMEAILKETFRELALKMRYEYGLTQSKMSRALVMSERYYEDIERGKTGCGALTVILLLAKIDNPMIFLNNLRIKLEKAYEMAGALV